MVFVIKFPLKKVKVASLGCNNVTIYRLAVLLIIYLSILEKKIKIVLFKPSSV